jgi:hypothetical protein
LPTTVTSDPFIFNASELEAFAVSVAQEYANAKPWPHVVIDDFLEGTIADRLLHCFPKADDPLWLDWRKRNAVNQPRKLGIGHARNLETAHPLIHNLLFAFNSYPFLNFLEKLTGIQGLIPDPYLNGGGIHQILSGGKLDVHADFNHLRALNLYRRINVLLYLNKNWREEYGGNLEMWTPESTECEKEVRPIFNRLVVFATTKSTLHGHPKPLNTPEDVTRKSLALYFYTATRDPTQHYDQKVDWRP